MAEQLTLHMGQHDIYDKYQSAFQKMTSTETTLVKITGISELAVLLVNSVASVTQCPIYRALTTFPAYLHS